ncbi:hypothetical protein [Undibacterium pigrum]|uniref:Uncharacterized protein n=1 Tax=Undibacterium pigrum TaxID=401470 RepID=A0A318IUH2_9BURK|nr:hypothetical protein [Undibacterium pigrum]PXX39816.1 hypothetical protein DFR42_110182 [Undibacterium pigrum]
MKRKYPLKSILQQTSQRHGNTFIGKGAARRERNRKFREQIASDMKSNRVSNFIFSCLERFIFPFFGGHWICLLFWPLLALAWVSYPGYPDLMASHTLFVTLAGGGSGVLLFTWQRRSPYLIMTGYGAMAGFVFGAITGTWTDAMQDAFIGMLFGLASPIFVTLFARYY